MTRIEFYYNVASKPQLLADLVQAALNKRRQVTILAADALAASQVSSDLWQAKPESFLPNVLANQPQAAQTPVLIDWDLKNLSQDDMLINLSAQQPSFFSRFTHLIELVGTDEQDKSAARLRYKFYRDRGYEIKNIDIKNIDQARLDKA
jgi:DNA polymerase III subunit chi